MRKKKMHEVIKDSYDNNFEKIVREDFRFLSEKVNLACTPEHKDLLLMQSLQGHAINGHGLFVRPQKDKLVEVQYKYPNCTLAEVVRALGLNPKTVVDQRERLITSVRSWIYHINKLELNPIKHKDPSYTKLVWGKEDRERRPLMGISLFEHTTINDPLSVIKGMYFGSCLDNDVWRQKTEIRFGITFHKGICYPVNIANLKKYDLTLEQLASNGGTLDEKELLAKNIISKDKKNTGLYKNDPPWSCGYYEMSKGPGVSDDAAFITMGLKYGIEAAFGFLIMDAIDTIDKFLPVIKPHGEDEALGDRIKEKFLNNGMVDISEDDITEFIFISRKDPHKISAWPSCSQRRFLQEEIYCNYPILAHMHYIKYLKNETLVKPPHMKISFEQTSNDKFYTEYFQRVMTHPKLKVHDKVKIEEY